MDSMDTILENKKKKLRNLPKYKDSTDAELEAVLEKNKYKNLSIETLFSDAEEIKLAKTLEKKYLEEFDLENISDKELLRSLIYLEVFQFRLQTTANEFKSTNGSIPVQIVDPLHKNINQIIGLKDRLGLNKKEKEIEETDALKSIELLKKKFKVWREHNQGSRTLVCPYCSKMVMLKIRTEAWEAQKHPFFQDRLLGNEHLISLYKAGRLDRVDISKILEVSTDYIDWLIGKWKADTMKIENAPPAEQDIATVSQETENRALSSLDINTVSDDKVSPSSSGSSLAPST
jgi:DNA-directed RNA polymerase subunit RPC12/RpoP